MNNVVVLSPCMNNVVVLSPCMNNVVVLSPCMITTDPLCSIVIDFLK